MVSVLRKLKHPLPNVFMRDLIDIFIHEVVVTEQCRTTVLVL